VSPQSQTQSQLPRAAGNRWRLQIVHRTRFSYSGPVRSSYNEARLTPENSARQTTLRSRVEIEPAATAYAYRDYWGSTVTAFDLHTPHAELVVTGTSIVEAGPDLPGHDRVGWSVLAGRGVRDEFGELLGPTPLTAVDDEVVQAARDAVGEVHPREAGPLVCRFVRERMEYLSGSTNVKTNAMQAWTKGKGVCQDISHVTVGLLRALGLPARYVSGYLHPKAERASVNRSPARATRGSSGGTAAGTASTRPTRWRSAPGTSRSAAGGTTATSLPSRGCSPGRGARGTR